MPFDNHTPEALVGRSDSKNPALTCRGITHAGRPCRRALAAYRSQSAPHIMTEPLVRPNEHVLDASHFCWQHKDQAHDARHIGQKAREGRNVSVQLFAVKERASIDSLTDRLGLVHIEESPNAPTHRTKRRRSSTRQSQEHSSQPRRNEQMSYSRCHDKSDHAMSNQAVKPGPFMGLLACFSRGRHQEPYYEVRRYSNRATSEMRQRRTSTVNYAQTTSNARDTAIQAPPAVHRPARPHRKPEAEQAARQPLQPLSSSRLNHPQPSVTQRYLSYIPPTLTPVTTALLLSELSKPISPHDGPGYIYIFWLTEQDHHPSSDSAYSLFDRPGGQSHLGRDNQPTLRLKIGRASNVHRRMTEWTQQCGQNLSLVRWYPYVSSSSPSPTRPNHGARQTHARQPSDGVRKVPFVNRVERLVHLELAEKRVKKDCGACGKEHREWFEVEATSEGVQTVDECIRRWVRWAEQEQGLR